jgi:protein O-GlcNAc transferase
VGVLQKGVFFLERGDTATGLSLFRRAVEWDPFSGDLRHEYALALSLTGHAAEAVRELLAACRLNPGNADFRFNLGLALNEVNDLTGATAALEEATRLDPEHGLAWYNLGLAYSAIEDPGRALEALLRAETVQPDSARIPYARATVLARLGRMKDAGAAARRALELDPDHIEAANLLRLLAHP